MGQSPGKIPGSPCLDLFVISRYEESRAENVILMLARDVVGEASSLVVAVVSKLLLSLLTSSLASACQRSERVRFAVMDGSSV